MILMANSMYQQDKVEHVPDREFLRLKLMSHSDLQQNE